jgi:hypothetical protein
MTTAKWSVFGRENSPTTAITTKGPFLCYYSRYKQFYKVGRCLGKHALYRQLILRTLPSNDENKKNTRKVIDTIDRFIGVLVPSNFHFESFCFPVHFLLTYSTCTVPRKTIVHNISTCTVPRKNYCTVLRKPSCTVLDLILYSGSVLYFWQNRAKSLPVESWFSTCTV